MKIQAKKTEHFGYVIVDDYYDENEQKQIWKELEFLTSPRILLPAQDTGSATKDGKVLKNNGGVFLDHFYNNRDNSNILCLNKKVYNDEIDKEFTPLHPYNELSAYIKYDLSLVSYYEDSDYYLPHIDISQFTSLVWFFKEPKCFGGGEFKFSNYEDVIELKHNRMILFPSWVMHEVSEVKMNEGFETDGYSTYGRYCITNFLFSNDDRSTKNQNPFELLASAFN